jgi:hypothetical protein
MDSMAGFVLTLSRLGVGAIGTFFAILLWSQTRDFAWVLVIIGTLVAYAEVVFSTLEAFGIVSGELLSVSGIPLLRLALANLPMLLLTCAFISVIARRRGR